MKRIFSLDIIKVIGIFVLFSSCEKYVDTTPPSIESFYINENDGSNGVDIDTLATDLEIRAFFKDDDGMLSYMITFESKDNDGPGLRVPAFLNDFDTFSVVGAQTEIYRILRVAPGPDSDGSYVAATGEYNIHLNARDISLNEASTATIAMEFRNYSPFIKYQDFLTDSIESTKGTTLPINYTVDDLDNNVNTIEMRMVLIIFDPEAIETGGRRDSLLYEFPIEPPVPGYAPYIINETFVLPDTGLYELRVLTKDDRVNETASKIVVTVPK